MLLQPVVNIDNDMLHYVTGHHLFSAAVHGGGGVQSSGGGGRTQRGSEVYSIDA